MCIFYFPLFYRNFLLGCLFFLVYFTFFSPFHYHIFSYFLFFRKVSPVLLLPSLRFLVLSYFLYLPLIFFSHIFTIMLFLPTLPFYYLISPLLSLSLFHSLLISFPLFLIAYFPLFLTPSPQSSPYPLPPFFAILPFFCPVLILSLLSLSPLYLLTFPPRGAGDFPVLP